MYNYQDWLLHYCDQDSQNQASDRFIIKGHFSKWMLSLLAEEPEIFETCPVLRPCYLQSHISPDLFSNLYYPLL